MPLLSNAASLGNDSDPAVPVPLSSKIKRTETYQIHEVKYQICQKMFFVKSMYKKKIKIKKKTKQTNNQVLSCLAVRGADLPSTPPPKLPGGSPGSRNPAI